MYEEIGSSRETRGTMWKTASASPPSGGRPRLAADHTNKEPYKDRTGGDLFLFTHLTVERCPFLFIYLFSTWSTWSAVGNLTSRAGELRSAPSGPDDWYRAAG